MSSPIFSLLATLVYLPFIVIAVLVIYALILSIIALRIYISKNKY